MTTAAAPAEQAHAGAPRLGLHLALVVLGGLALHLLVAANTDLVPDEAYYAAWSHRLAAAYFDHPPAVAWLVAAARALAGEGALAVRLPALLAGALVPVLLALAALRLYGPHAAVRAAWLASGTLLLHVLGLVVTPDTPLVLAWSAAILVAADLVAQLRRVDLVAEPSGEGGAGAQRRVRGAGLHLVVLGALSGAAILAKLTGWALLAGLVLAILWAPTVRRALGARVLLVPAAALLVASPWLAATLAAPGTSDAAFQLSRVRLAGMPLVHLPELVLGQTAVLGPVVAVGLVLWARAALARRDDADRLLLALALPLLAAFVALALLRRVEVNWPGPAWLAALVGLSGRGLGRLRRWALWSAAPVVLLVHVLAVTGLPGALGERDPTARLHGWSHLGALLEARCRAADPAGGVRLLAAGYDLGAEAAFYAPACRPMRVLPDGRRSQWDRWPAPPAPRAGSALLLTSRPRLENVPKGCVAQGWSAVRAGGRARLLVALSCGPTPK